MLKIEAVDAQDDDKRTQIIFVPASDGRLDLFALKAGKLFPGSNLAAEVADILQVSSPASRTRPERPYRLRARAPCWRKSRLSQRAGTSPVSPP